MPATTYGAVTRTDTDYDTDVKRNGCADDFTGTTFNKGGAGETIKGVNFSFAKFDTCTFAAGVFEECNFTGCEGDSIPDATEALKSNISNLGSGTWGNRTAYLATLP